MRIGKILALVLFFNVSVAMAEIPVGAAPEGDATKVATKIIKYNFPECRRVTKARRLHDGAISAYCDGTEYRVFTVFNKQKGKLIDVSLNCDAARKLNIQC
jgi:hypothetical protein